MIDLTLSSDEEAPPKRHEALQATQPQHNCGSPNLPSAAEAVAAPSGHAHATFPPFGESGARGHAATDLDQDHELEPTQRINPSGPDGTDDLLHFLTGFNDNDDGSDDADGAGSGGADANPGRRDQHADGNPGGCGAPGTSGRGANGANGRRPCGRRKKEEIEEDGGPSCDSEAAAAAAAPKKRRGGGGKRLTAEEREERDRAKAAEKAAKAAERARIREEKAAAKEAEKERKASEKDEQKRAKAAEKESAKEQKEAGNALKVTMVGRYMRLLISNTLAATPLGYKIVDMIPVVRGNKKDETFPHEVHKDMPLAARGYKYCMWGMRLPAASAARLQAAEGCALEASGLPEPSGRDSPLMLFPALLLVLTGDELLLRLEADPAAPLGTLYNDVVRAHPFASPVVYVVGLEEAMRRRERANRSFNRMAVEDLLFDVAVGMPAVRLQYDCPEGDLTRAANDILNLGYTLSQQPKKRLEAYLDTFGSRTTVPLRAVKEVLAQQGGTAQLTLCEALSQLVAPQRAAAVAAEYPSLAALIEALKARPEGRSREALLAKCRIPGVVAAKGRQQVAGPAAAARLARFLLMQNGREEWKETEE